MPPTPPNWLNAAQTFGRLHLVQADITKLNATAIVNAANSSLLGGGGVDGAIHRAGGPQILAECQAIRARQGGCKTGEAVITSGGKLPAAYVIHTVGPVYQDGRHGEPALLVGCYRHSLRLAAENELDSVAFPGISTGIYGYPKAEAAAIAVREVRAFLAESEFPRTVVFVAFEEGSRRLYERELAPA